MELEEGMSLALKARPEVKGVCGEITIKDNGHVWCILKCSDGTAVDARNTQVHPTELTADELEIARATGCDEVSLLQARLDALSTKLDSEMVVKNSFKAKDGTTWRQFVALRDGSVACTLCPASPCWVSSAVKSSFHPIKCHFGFFKSTQNSPDAILHLRRLRDLLDDADDRKPSTKRAASAPSPPPPSERREEKKMKTAKSSSSSSSSSSETVLGVKKPPNSRRKSRAEAAAPETTTRGERPRELLKFTALKQLHPDLVKAGSSSSRAFKKKNDIMPSFDLENADGVVIQNERHEAFEQFVVAWIFNEIVPRQKRGLRVLELGGGIGAVSTMVQQMIEGIESSASHVVFEPNERMAKGPLSANRARYRSRFDIFCGVLSKQPEVELRAGEVCPEHPRAWMWRTVATAENATRGEPSATVPGYPLADVIERLGGPPTVLIADCEGGLIPALSDFPQVLDAVCVLYYERDPPGDYAETERLLVDRGFCNILKANLHRVWVREEAFDELDDPRVVARSRDPSSPIDRRLAAAVARVASLAAEIRNLQTLRHDVDALAARAGALDQPAAAVAACAALRADCDRRLAVAARAHACAESLARERGTTHDVPRRLARNTRVECLWHEGDWSDWFPGQVGESPVVGDGYSVMFDDLDERFDVPTAELRAVYIKGSFDWVSPWRDDHLQPLLPPRLGPDQGREDSASGDNNLVIPAAPEDHRGCDDDDDDSTPDSTSDFPSDSFLEIKRPDS
ncbi:hypothetical protein CTAYLR_009122 [Chrysophaeum taylorii]|uniref:Uncharacterized protein n=1 Tax=Chrysophaeum taylorii TaxID=2483200 RepID=A0AAD7XSD0_9STRA|nr:hypothetical protein CTAYLR_009122 [Chrysophaeum taylorii]